MRQYLELMREVLESGVARADRTGTGTRSVFGRQLRFALSEGFPLLTTKKLHFQSVVYELAWFLRGETNVHYLQQRGVRIWNEWADSGGDLGPVYGAQWRAWRSHPDAAPHDQIWEVIEAIRQDPSSRRLIVSAWNVGDLPRMALPPCHLLSQFYVADGRLSCQLYQRSADIFLGLPFNIASYALLTMMMAQLTGLKPGDFVISLGDTHLYDNHVEQARIQLRRKLRPLPELQLSEEICAVFLAPLSAKPKLPDIVPPGDSAFMRRELQLTLPLSGVEQPKRRAYGSLRWDQHIKLRGYKPHAHIAAPVAV